MTFAYSASGTVNASAALVNVRHKPELLSDNLVREINYFIMFLYYKWVWITLSFFYNSALLTNLIHGFTIGYTTLSVF